MRANLRNLHKLTIHSYLSTLIRQVVNQPRPHTRMGTLGRGSRLAAPRPLNYSAWVVAPLWMLCEGISCVMVDWRWHHCDTREKTESWSNLREKQEREKKLTNWQCGVIKLGDAAGWVWWCCGIWGCDGASSQTGVSCV